MSRTKRGEKGPGYEYWSRRPGNRHGGTVGPEQKKQTHSTERMQGKQQSREEDDGL